MKMYRIQPLYEINIPKPSPVIYACNSYHEDIDAQKDGGKGDKNHSQIIDSSSSSKTSGKSCPSSLSPAKRPSLSRPVFQYHHHHHMDAPSDIELRQMAVLTKLHELNVIFDKLSGKSGGKKRAIAQAGEVKRQKTESVCEEESAEETEPDTMILTEPVDFAVYPGQDKSKSGFQKHFPLIIILGYDDPVPLSLFVLASILRERAASTAAKIGIGLRSFIHNSVSLDESSKAWNAQREFNKIANDGFDDIDQCGAVINFIWKKESNAKGPLLLLPPPQPGVDSPRPPIVGELAVAVYLAKLTDFYPIAGCSPEAAFLSIDYWLYSSSDAFAAAKPAYPEMRQVVLADMNAVLAKRRFLIGDRITFADVFLWSILTKRGVKIGRSSSIRPLPENTKNWLRVLNSVKAFAGARALVR